MTEQQSLEELYLREYAQNEPRATIHDIDDGVEIQKRERRGEVRMLTAFDYALADGLQPAGGEYVVGEQLYVQFESTETTEYRERDIEDLKDEFGGHIQFKKKNDRRESVEIWITLDTDRISLDKFISTLTEEGVYIRGISAGVSSSDDPFVVIYPDFSGTGKDPYEMAGVSERETPMLYRHEALTIVEALDGYQGSRKSAGRIKNSLIEEFNLHPYLVHLDDYSGKL